MLIDQPPLEVHDSVDFGPNLLRPIVLQLLPVLIAELFKHGVSPACFVPVSLDERLHAL